MLVGLLEGLEPKKSEALTSLSLGLGRLGLGAGAFLGEGETFFDTLGCFTNSSSESESEITLALFFLSVALETLADESFLVTGGLEPPLGPKKLRISIMKVFLSKIVFKLKYI